MKKEIWILITIGISLLAVGSWSLTRQPDPRKGLGETVPANARAGELSLEACTIPVKGRRLAAECGTLVTAENPNNPEGRLISLPVVRLLSTSENPGNPIFWLQGGPGASNLSGFTPSDAVLAAHDVVYIGYRGMDGSSDMKCPGMKKAARGDGLDLMDDASLDIFGQALQDCSQQLTEQGYDLDQYTMVQVAADFEAARQALGYDQIHLLGASYGTRMAQVYSKLYPGAIASAALFGVNPDGHMALTSEEVQVVIDEYSRLVALDPALSQRTDDFSATLKQVLAEAPSHWSILRIDPGKLRLVLYVFFYHRNTAALAVDAVLAANEGDYSGIALMSVAADFVFPGMLQNGDLYAKGYTGDFDPQVDYKETLKTGETALGAPLGYLLFGQSGKWGGALVPEEVKDMHDVEVPFLLVNGNLDISTPPANMALLAETLSNSQQVYLTDMGHVDDTMNLQPEAFDRLILSFYETGVGDASGYSTIPMSFEIALGFPLVAKLLVGLMMILVVGIPLGGWVYLQRRKKQKGN